MRPSHRTRAFTMLELVVVILVIVGIVSLFLPAIGAPRGHSANKMQNSSQLRGIHQSMVVFSQSNNGYLPGLDTDGNLVANGAATRNSGAGYTGAARFWILLHGEFIGSDLLLNPKDSSSVKYVDYRSPLTRSNYSYASLSISGMSTSSGRCAEWRDNANSTASLVSDRNIGSSNSDKDVSSFWTNQPGDWKGNQVWGDNHAEFVQSNRGFATRYLSSSQTNDNLFATVAAPGVTENSTAPDANAWMVWN